MEDLCEVEVECIKLLQFKLDYNTSFHFLEMFLSMGIITEEETELLANDDKSLKFSSKTPLVHPLQYDEDLTLKDRAYSSGSYQNMRKANNLLALDKLYNNCYEMLELSIESNYYYIILNTK